MKRRLSPIALFFVLFAPSVGISQSWPASPVHPTSNAQCYAIFEDYMAIRSQFVSQAKSFRCLERASTGHEVLHACEAERRTAWDKASEVLSRATRAREACFAQVRVHGAEQRRLARGDRDNEAQAKLEISNAVSNRIIDVAKNEILRTLGQESAEFKAFQSALSTSQNIASRINTLNGGIPRGANARLDGGLSRLRGSLDFNPLRKLSLDIATGLTRSLYDTSMRDLEAMTRSVSLANLAAQTSNRMNSVSSRVANTLNRAAAPTSGLSTSGEVFRTFEDARKAASADVKRLQQERRTAAAAFVRKPTPKRSSSSRTQNSSASTQRGTPRTSGNNAGSVQQYCSALLSEREQKISQARRGVGVNAFCTSWEPNFGNRYANAGCVKVFGLFISRCSRGFFQ